MNTKINYKINIEGCDDTTTITYPLINTEFALIEDIIKTVNSASNYNCQPTMSIEKLESSTDM